MGDTLTNMWGKIKIFCLNHDEPVEMHIVSNTELIKTPFYACKYNLAEKEEENQKEVCSNRLNLDNYQEIVMAFLEHVSDTGLISDYTNYSFTYKRHQQKILVKVIKWSDKEVWLGIINKKVLGVE